MSELCSECGAPLSIGQGCAEVEIDALKAEIERLQARCEHLEAIVRQLQDSIIDEAARAAGGER